MAHEIGLLLGSPSCVKRRIGVVGYGKLGQFLVRSILQRDDLELAFVWNRTKSTLVEDKLVDQSYIVDSLDDVADRRADLIVEMSHPDVTERYAERLLAVADYMICSPTALANQETERRLRSAAAATKHGLYIPSGALWGADDINKMADMGTLQRLKVTMSFHPDSLKLNEPLKQINSCVTKEKVILYEGNVRGLCPLAPNNVNTMAAASLAAHTLGMDRVEGCLISDPSLHDFHVVQVDVWGDGDIQADKAFHLRTVRRNPAPAGQVTGSATVTALWHSVLRAHGKGPGVHFC